MILPDANLILYAYDSDSPFNKQAVKWWSACLSGNESIGLCEAVIYSFIRIGTHARAFANPLSVDEASDMIKSWLAEPHTEILSGDADDLNVALALLQKSGTGGNLTTDAQIAALSLRHDAIIHTADTDFVRFKGVRWYNPMLETAQ